MMPLEQRKAALEKWKAHLNTLSTEEVDNLMKPIFDRVQELKMLDFIFKITTFLNENKVHYLKFDIIDGKIGNHLYFNDSEYVVEYHDNYLLGEENIEIHNKIFSKEKEILLREFSLELFMSFKDEIKLLSQNIKHSIVYVTDDIDYLNYYVYKSETKESFIEKVVSFLNKYDLKQIQFDLLVYSSDREYKNIFFTRNDDYIFKDDFSMPKELKENEDFIEFLEYFCSDITHEFINGKFEMNLLVTIDNQGNIIESDLPDNYKLEPLKRGYKFDNKYFL
jgi:hypothetical protein